MDEILENFFNLEVLEMSAHLLRNGLIHTLMLTGLAFGVALVLGVIVAYGRTHRSRFIRGITIAFIDVIRALPPLVTLMLMTYLIPALGGFTIATLHSAVITFGLIHAAYVGEIYRGGIIALERGQIDAARAVGLSSWQAARLVLLPLMSRVIVPPLTNEAAFVVRNSSLAYFIGYPELLQQARQAVTLTANSTPIAAATLIYAAMLMVMQGISIAVERRMYSEAVDAQPSHRWLSRLLPSRRVSKGGLTR